MPIKVEWDNDFQNAYGAKALFNARAILACAQNVFRWPSWKIKIELRLIKEMTSKPNYTWTIEIADLYVLFLFPTYYHLKSRLLAPSTVRGAAAS